MTVKEAHIVQLPKMEDERGNLSFLEEGEHIPFDIKRVYWIYDVPGGEYRGAHAYKANQEFIVALSGSFDVVLDDGKEKKVFSLNRSYYALYVPNGLWRYIDNFSTNALAFIASSTVFNQNDYIRDYNAFLAYKEEGGSSDV